MTTDTKLHDAEDALYRRQESREMLKALTAILITSAMICGSVLALSNWIGHRPQVINVYVTHG